MLSTLARETLRTFIQTYHLLHQRNPTDAFKYASETLTNPETPRCITHHLIGVSMDYESPYVVGNDVTTGRTYDFYTAEPATFHNQPFILFRKKERHPYPAGGIEHLLHAISHNLSVTAWTTDDAPPIPPHDHSNQRNRIRKTTTARR